MLDKTGEVSDAIRRATTVDPATAVEPLDGYINMYYRSAKNARVGLGLASLLDAQESIPVQQVARVGTAGASAAS